MDTTIFIDDSYRELLSIQEEVIKTEWYIQWMEEVHESISDMINIRDYYSN